MKKIGIVTCYFKNNYGSMLQAYATKKILDNNDIPNETINIDYNQDFKKGKRKYYFTQITNFKFIKNKLGMIKLKFDKKINKELGKNIATRNKAYKNFRQEINLSRTNKNYNELTEQAKELYSDVIVGSDQLWLPVNVVSDYYTLNWVSDEVNKISYSTSFGFSSIPKKYNALYKKFLSRLNFISTREESGVKIIKDVADIDAKLVCDPTILLTKEEWLNETSTKRIYEDKYILCYFLGNNIEHRKFAERLRAKTGYKIVSLNHADEYVKYSDKFCDYAPFDVGPREWINLVANAEYVLTDSFHCTVFSILFNKMFFDFRRHNNKSKVSTNSRIDSLLDVAGISKERILNGTENIDDVLNYEIEYDSVNENINKFREESKEWLLNSIKWKDNSFKHVDVSCKEDCCGCSACKSICPQKAIEMKEDEEGFLYPFIDEKKCTQCGACKRVCPIINEEKEKACEQYAYILNNKNDEIRKESTSGGFFTEIAKYTLKNNGVVYGASFIDKFEVAHTKALKIDELVKYRNSKYVQSNLLNSFNEVRTYLNEGRLVCYSGTPCQIEGLQHFLNKEYENLITVDVVCRAVPSPKLLRKYISYVKKRFLKGEEIEFISFRNKDKYGYKYTQMKIKSKNHKYESGIESDPYLRAFFEGYSTRPSCAKCRFKKRYRKSDFTMWDCFNVENFNKKMDDNLGTTRVLIHTKKGKKIFDIISENFVFVEVNPDVAIKDSRELIKSTNRNGKAKVFFEDINLCDIENVFNKYFSDTLRVKLERTLRKRLVNLKMYKRIKRIAKRILKRG